MDDFVHGVRSNVHQIGVKKEQKRPCTLWTKYYYGVHNDPRLLRFSTQISLFKQLSYGEFYFEYFPTGGRIELNSYQSFFFSFRKTLLMCLFFGLKCLKIDWFWSSFDLLEDVLSGITVPNNKITIFFFYSQKVKKVFFSYFLQFLEPLKKWKFWEKKNLSKFVCIFWTWQLWIMYHCILPCKFNHLWSIRA